jgi:hypothetical protein
MTPIVVTQAIDLQSATVLKLYVVYIVTRLSLRVKAYS